MVAVREEVGPGEGFKQIRQPDTFTSVNIYRARNGEEVGGPRGWEGREEAAWARDIGGEVQRHDGETLKAR